MVDDATRIPIDEARAETPFSATLGTEANEAARVKLTATPEGLVVEIGFVGADLPEFARSSEGRERLRSLSRRRDPRHLARSPAHALRHSPHSAGQT